MAYAMPTDVTTALQILAIQATSSPVAEMFDTTPAVRGEYGIVGA